MASLIYLPSAFIAVAATILAVSAPRVLAERYKRWITPIYYVVIAGVAWIFVSGSSYLTAINTFAEDRSISPESALHTIRMFASEAVSQRRYRRRNVSTDDRTIGISRAKPLASY